MNRLTLFFDGVPPESTGAVSAAPGPAATMTAATNAPPGRAAAPKVQPVILHPPFADRQCDACHESKFSQKLSGKSKTFAFPATTISWRRRRSNMTLGIGRLPRVSRSAPVAAEVSVEAQG